MFVALFALLCFLLVLMLPNQQIKWIRAVATWSGLVGVGLSSWQCMEFIEGATSLSVRIKWFEIASTSVELVLKIDAMSVFFQLVVALVVCAVHIYSLIYFQETKEKIKFYYASLSLFVFAMQALLVQDNWIAFFICWELMGLASFLLIDFNKSVVSARASVKAFLLNRLGDVGLFIAIVLLWQKSIYITDIKDIFTTFSSTDQLLIAIGIALAAWIKTGQFPFSTWLTDAMQAPTPISALLHAATMVAAGVYLLIRCESIFQELTLLTSFLIGTGLLSSFLAAYSAYFTSSLKRQLAASTVSQLGFMLIAIWIGAWQAALLHVFVHAFFKAVLFLHAGYLIHHTHQTTLHKIGELVSSKKTLLVVFHLLATAALLGLPLSSGFLSKEWILGSSFQQDAFVGSSLIIISFFTAMYAGRQVQTLFFTKSLPSRIVFSSSIRWVFPIGILSVGSLWIVFSLNPFSMENTLFVTHFTYSFTTPSPLWLPIVELVSTSIGFVVGFSKSLFTYLKSTKANFEHYFQWQDNFFIYLFWQPITKLALFTTHKTSSIPTTTFVSYFTQVGSTLAGFDRKMDKLVDDFSKVVVVWSVFSAWIDKFIVDGLLTLFTFGVALAGRMLKSLQNGKVQFYISIVFLLLIGGLILLLS